MEYKQITGTDYWVTNDGKVFSVKFSRTKELTPRIQSGGYLQIQMCMEGKTKSYLVHRLVALNFLEKPEGKDYINHKDGNKLNNTIDNLEWVSAMDNVRHAFYTGLKDNKRRLDYDKAEEIRSSDLGTKLLSKIYGVSRATITKIKNRQLWKTKK